MGSAAAEPSEVALRIAVDARPLNQKFSGIGQYLFQMLDHLLVDKAGTPQATRNQTTPQWMLYSDQPLDIPTHWQNVTTRTGTTTNRWLGTAIAQFQFGLWALEDQATLYWSPRHQLPFGLPKDLPAVVTLHDLVFRLYPETMSRAGRCYDAWLTPRALRRAQSIITTSAAVTAELKSLYPECANKSRAIGLSSALEVSANSAGKNRHKKPYAIFCGSMEPRKNLDRFIQALANLNAKREQPIALVIVSGGGWRNKSTLDLIEQYSAFIDYRPAISAEEKNRLIQNATCLVLPSLYEGFGLPIVEAQSLGVPVLTSNRGAMREVAGDGALLIDPTDETNIAEELARFFDDPELRDRLAANSVRLGEQHSWARSAQLTLEVLSSAEL